MARLKLTVQSVVARYPALPLTANSADFAFTAAGVDFEDGFEFVLTGREVLLVQAPADGCTVTLNSVADPYKRTGDITAYALGASEFAAFYPPVEGFRRSDGTIWGAVSAADVNLAVLRLPS